MLTDFYTVFVRNMRELGTPVYSQNFFREVLEVFPDHTRIITVYLKEQPVAAGFVIHWKSPGRLLFVTTTRSVPTIFFTGLLCNLHGRRGVNDLTLAGLHLVKGLSNLKNNGEQNQSS